MRLPWMTTPRWIILVAFIGMAMTSPKEFCNPW
jgi:hypothetical protein